MFTCGLPFSLIAIALDSGRECLGSIPIGEIRKHLSAFKTVFPPHFEKNNVAELGNDNSRYHLAYSPVAYYEAQFSIHIKFIGKSKI